MYTVESCRRRQPTDSTNHLRMRHGTNSLEPCCSGGGGTAAAVTAACQFIFSSRAKDIKKGVAGPKQHRTVLSEGMEGGVQLDHTSRRATICETYTHQGAGLLLRFQGMLIPVHSAASPVPLPPRPRGDVPQYLLSVLTRRAQQLTSRRNPTLTTPHTRLLTTLASGGG